MPGMLIETETTPNPATLKFLPGRAVMDSGTRDFATPEEAEASPLAQALFERGYWVAAIRPPTVPAGTARLRITLTAGHGEAEVDGLVDALEAALRQGGTR